MSERAGVINLGMEGTMLMGASMGFIATSQSGSPWLGLAAAAVAGALFNLVLGYLVITRNANQLASGLALGFYGIGLSALLGKAYVGRLINGLDEIPIPLLSEVPILGPVLFEHDILIYLALPIAILLWWVLFYTNWGLSIRSVGESKTVAYTAGKRPQRLQYQAVLLAGALAGLGGAHLSLAFTGVWSESMTAGRGFIAVALVIFAAWNPLRAVAGAMLFGGALALQLQLQARGAPISPFLLDMFPYLLTLAVLLFVRGSRRNSMPEGLKTVFQNSG